jgi:hypothetical protein
MMSGVEPKIVVSETGTTRHEQLLSTAAHVAVVRLVTGWGGHLVYCLLTCGPKLLILLLQLRVLLSRSGQLCRGLFSEHFSALCMNVGFKNSMYAC